MNQMSKIKIKAFTLIELLIVIAIIGLLASITLIALNNSRKQARITKRISDLKQMSAAVELYFLTNNFVPGTVTSPSYSECAGFSTTVTSPNALIPGIVPSFASSLPRDPAMNVSAGQNCYVFMGTSKDYKIMSYNITDMTLAEINQHPEFKDPRRNSSGPCSGLSPATLSLSVHTDGARCW